MKCKSCGAQLTIDGGKYCPYCGAELQNDINVHIKKETLSKTEILDHGRIAEATADERKTKSWVMLRFTSLIVLLIITLGIFFMVYSSGANSQRQKILDEARYTEQRNAHDKEIERLQAIEDEILQDIRDEKYEQAMAKSKTLIYTGTYSDRSKKAWDEKRQELVNTLAELLKRKQ